MNDKIEEIKSYCNISDFEGNLENYFIENDIVIFPFFKTFLKEEVLAFAKACFLDSNYRPIFGIVNINKQLSFETKNINRYLKSIL